MGAAYWWLAVCLAVSSPSPVLNEPAKVAGVWKFTVELGVGTGHPTVTIKQDGEKITGTYDGRYGPSPLEGTIKDNKIDFTVSMTAEGAAVIGTFTGVVEADGMSGSVAFDQAGDGTWSAVKAPPKPPAGPALARSGAGDA
jgi:hypothetical protein